MAIEEISRKPQKGLRSLGSGKCGLKTLKTGIPLPLKNTFSFEKTPKAQSRSVILFENGTQGGCFSGRDLCSKLY